MAPWAQRLIALVALICVSPVIGLLAAAVRLDSRGPAFYRARRLGASGTFELLKLRSMTSQPDAGMPSVTARHDPRITGVGRFMRRRKLDELPQLWNVIRGDMLLVGPRPEDPRYFDQSDPSHAVVFRARPGITGVASLAMRNEEEILQEAAELLARSRGHDQPDGRDVDDAYRNEILPRKVALEMDYLATRSARTDMGILIATARALIRTGN